MVFSWDQVIAEILPDYVSGIVLVLSTATKTFTFTVTNGKVLLTGSGDLHDKTFDNYQRAISATLLSRSSTSYSIRVYPSITFQNSYIDNRPRDSCIEVVVVIFATSLVFFLYDVLVAHRETALRAVARSTSAVVDGLFPGFVRDRLIGRHSSGDGGDSSLQSSN